MHYYHINHAFSYILIPECSDLVNVSFGAGGITFLRLNASFSNQQRNFTNALLYK